MRKPITPTVHGALDYTTSLMTAAAPELLDLPRPARVACYALAGSYGALSMLTDYPLGVRRAVPYRAHGLVDVALGLALPALPWVLGFARHERARNFWIGLSVVSAITTTLTDWDAADGDARRGRGVASTPRRIVERIRRKAHH